MTTDKESSQNIPQDIAIWLEKANKLRLNLPEESQNPWLSFLLDAYAIIDASLQEAKEREKKKNKKIACSEACTYCCSQAIPISPAEAMGIRLTIQKLLPKAEREKLIPQLIEQNGTINWKNGQCPFLVDNLCSIYLVRPVGCRRYLVLNNPCTTYSEDVIKKRPDDFLYSDKAAMYAAYAHTSPIYASLGISEKGKTLTFDNFKKLFVDIRTIKWL